MAAVSGWQGQVCPSLPQRDQAWLWVCCLPPGGGGRLHGCRKRQERQSVWEDQSLSLQRSGSLWSVRRLQRTVHSLRGITIADISNMCTASAKLPVLQLSSCALQPQAILH